jgi:ABC-type branched-subunit amino acid transport system substrate-binding protein
MMISRRALIGSALSLPFVVREACAAEVDPGISPTEIKLGQTTAYSGPVSGAGSYKKVQAAFFAKLNAEGGISGRKVSLISLDDAYSPPKTVEATRRLVEGDEVFAMFNSFGTPTQSAVLRYLNVKKVPQLFVSSGAARFNDPKNAPWTTPGIPDLHKVGVMYAQFIIAKHPDAKIAVLYQNDDFGKDSLKGIKDGLGAAKQSLLISEAAYDVTQPTIDSQIVTLKASGADALINLTTGRFTVQSIKRMHEIGWRPIHVVHGSFGTIYETFRPVGLDICKGIYSSAFVKDPADLQWEGDQEMRAYFDFMKSHVPDIEAQNRTALSSFVSAQVMAHVIEQAGKNPTRESLLQAALTLDNPKITSLLMPGVQMKTSNENRYLFSNEVMAQFDGRIWNQLAA